MKRKNKIGQKMMKDMKEVKAQFKTQWWHLLIKTERIKVDKLQ